MKKLLIALTLLLISSPAMAQQYTNGYYRNDGTYVNGYYRSRPDNTVQNNYSYQGNTNPYTGQQGSNRYYSNPSSQYYGGGQSNSYEMRVR